MKGKNFCCLIKKRKKSSLFYPLRLLLFMGYKQQLRHIAYVGEVGVLKNEKKTHHLVCVKVDVLKNVPMTPTSISLKQNSLS